MGVRLCLDHYRRLLAVLQVRGESLRTYTGNPLDLFVEPSAPRAFTR